MSQVQHPDSQRLHQILHELGELHDRKQQDYGTTQDGRTGDPFANIHATAEWCCPSCHVSIPAWLGALIRLNDKVVRLKSYTRNGSLANEGVVDSLRDIAVYAAIAQVMWEQENPSPSKKRYRYDCHATGCVHKWESDEWDMACPRCGRRVTTWREVE